MIADPQTYALFTVAAIALYWSLPAHTPTLRAYLLVAFSVVLLYLASPPSLAIMLAMSGVVLLASRALRKLRGGLVIGASVVLIIAILAAAKYLLPAAIDTRLGIAAALGLSYVALKSISAVVDDNDRAEDREPPLSASQVMLLNGFYPIYTAGPIERLDAFSRDKLSARFDPTEFVYGLIRIFIGLFKQAYIADKILKPYMDGAYPTMYQNPSAYGVLDAHLFVWLLFLHLYFSFSGYSDIAIGTGRLFNLKIVENFRYPFLATNLQEFWGRWHISLANFAFDYIFFPLARWRKGLTSVALIIAFVLIGLWHEVSVKWLVWGAMHGVGLVTVAFFITFSRERPWLNAARRSIPAAALGWFLTMSWVAWSVGFAMANNLSQAYALGFRLMGLTP